ncbi:IS3 family transposase [Oligella ureolytica]|jgi:putative transposase
MSKRKTESQIIALLKKAEAGIPVAELCRQEGVSVSTFYSWRAKYGGMEVSEAQRLKELEEENRRLKQMYAELSLKSQLQEEIIKKL